MESKIDGLMFLLFCGAIYAIVQIVDAIVAAILVFLMGLVYIALGIVGILAAFFLYRYITDKQYGETKKVQQIEKLERQRKVHIARLPKHLREQASEYYFEKQRAHFDIKPHARLDECLDRTKQVFSTFHRGE